MTFVADTVVDRAGSQVREAAPRVRSPTIASRFRRGDELGLFIVAAAGMVLLAPRFLVLANHWLGGSLSRPDLSAWPYVPLILPLGVAAALLTFRMGRTARLGALVGLIVPLGWVHGRIDETTVLPLAAFALIAYAIVRLPLPRFPVALLMTAHAVAGLLAAVHWWGDTPVVIVLGGFPVLVPMLWYSVYEHRQRKPLGLRRFLTHLAGRLFSSPVMTHADLFRPVTGAELTAVRWAGIRAIYIALVASLVAHFAEAVSTHPGAAAIGGFQLLALSYIEYVAFCCRIVVRFNVFIGVVRLFGVPVRNNFRYWLLARTPNEHWQRWNILAREWFVTFLFYPIMRARRWLFAAVMAALLGAGVLHTVPYAIINGFHAPRATASLIYWTVNGLAIYLVIKIPLLYPRLIDRAHIRDSHAWSVAGIVLTSAFYSVLHGLRTSSQSWAQMEDYVSRLLGVWPV